MGRAVQLAAQDIKEQLAHMAGPKIFGTSPDDVILRTSR